MTHLCIRETCWFTAPRLPTWSVLKVQQYSTSSIGVEQTYFFAGKKLVSQSLLKLTRKQLRTYLTNRNCQGYRPSYPRSLARRHAPRTNVIPGTAHCALICLRPSRRATIETRYYCRSTHISAEISLIDGDPWLRNYHRYRYTHYHWTVTLLDYMLPY